MSQKAINLRKAKRYARDFVIYLKKNYHLPITSAYLFGSFTRGKTRPDSDIDVCIISPKFKRTDPLIFLWTHRREIDIERGIEPYGVHPVDFVDENPIAYQVKKFGQLLNIK